MHVSKHLGISSSRCTFPCHFYGLNCWQTLKLLSYNYHSCKRKWNVSIKTRLLSHKFTSIFVWYCSSPFILLSYYLKLFTKYIIDIHSSPYNIIFSSYILPLSRGIDHKNIFYVWHIFRRHMHIAMNWILIYIGKCISNL